MKVWYILMTFPLPSETFVCNDVGALRRLGVEVEVHALLAPRPDAEHLLAARGLAGLTVSHGGPGRLLAGLATGLRRPLSLLRLLGWVLRHSGGNLVHLAKAAALVPRSFDLIARLERDPPDAVHLYWGHYPAVFARLVQMRAPRVVVSLSLSAYDLLRDFPGSGDVARRADLVSTWAEANVAPIAALGVAAEQMLVSYQGVDLDRLRGRSFAKVAGRVVTAGRLVEEKGMGEVVEAFARGAADHPGASLVVLGEGPDLPRLQRLAAQLGVGDRVELRGHVAHDEVFAAMSEAVLFLLLSREKSERLPNVVKEAMACRCLCVVSETPGIEELIADGVHGWVHRAEDIPAVAGRIRAALADPVTAAAMAEAGAERVFAQFDLLRLMEGFAQRWQHLARVKRGATAERS